MGYSSLHDYCAKALHLTDYAGYARIEAARWHGGSASSWTCCGTARSLREQRASSGRFRFACRWAA
jgi:hypothetical protein